jgi:hypothetical protein
LLRFVFLIALGPGGCQALFPIPSIRGIDRPNQHRSPTNGASALMGIRVSGRLVLFDEFVPVAFPLFPSRLFAEGSETL